MFDFFFDEEHDDIDKINDPMAQLVHKWCKDDKGRNILYKKNGDERYPEFKLYKMIARNVHHCTPEKEIQNNLFVRLDCLIHLKQSNIGNPKMPRECIYGNCPLLQKLWG